MGVDLGLDLVLQYLQVVERLRAGTSVNGGEISGIVDLASSSCSRLSVMCCFVPISTLLALP